MWTINASLMPYQYLDFLIKLMVILIYLDVG